MRTKLKNIISYVIVSTIIFTNTFIYADNTNGQVINEDEEIHNQEETLEDEIENDEKDLESKEEPEEPEEAEEIEEEPTQPKEEEPEPEIEKPKPVVVPKKFVNSSHKYTLKQIEEDISRISKQYEDITTVEVIGKSYEGKPINAIKLSVPSEFKKPNILLMGNIHAREDFSATLVMKMLDYITYSYYDTGFWGNYNVKEILDQIDIYFIPVANPDGLNIAHLGLKASSNYDYLRTIPNIAGDSRWWKSNARGVDLNRNFDDGNWHLRSNAGPSSEGYRGSSPSSEVETKAIQKFCNEKNPLLAISYHSSGNLFYWADSDTHSIFKGYDTQIVNRMRNITGYKVMPVSKNPASFGAGFENWFKKRFNRFGMCVELSPSPGRRFVQHPDEKFNALVWPQAKFTGIQLAVEGLDIEGKMYDVYQYDKYLKTFYNKEEAWSYAKQWANSSVKIKAYHVYQGDNYLETFYNYKPALNYAKQWNGYKIVREDMKVGK